MQQKQEKSFLIGQLVGTTIVTGIYIFLIVTEKPIPGMIDTLFGLAIATLLIGEKAVDRIAGRRGPPKDDGQ